MADSSVVLNVQSVNTSRRVGFYCTSSGAHKTTNEWSLKHESTTPTNDAMAQMRAAHCDTSRSWCGGGDNNNQSTHVSRTRGERRDSVGLMRYDRGIIMKRSCRLTTDLHR
ncbi:hypothetical protein F2P81_023821 [Scophthalmus maximus]|uniref:Uncharacterized protein n=1 Tax=Scophthalmus maximus TaxID=52904 RepID=A0A6A4RVM3_SCOMX|nr:hypothetical protein F2P81_023821 [Scophthalmus maximus]